MYVCVLTIEPAALFAEARPQERTLAGAAQRQIVERGGHRGDNQRHTPGVHLVDAQPQQFLRFFQRCRTEVPERPPDVEAHGVQPEEGGQEEEVHAAGCEE